MKIHTNFPRRFEFIVAGMCALLVVAAGMLSGCKRVTGERIANEAPLVWFVNVPPKDQKVSANPLINWVGQDRDGQVVQFRYRVIRETQIMVAIEKNPISVPDLGDIAQYTDLLAKTLPDSVWAYLTVDPQKGQPQTSVTIPLVAELNDPVRTYVPQYVFVQAIDDRGLTSNIANRRFVRNNNPPLTKIWGFDSSVTPYIDALVPGGIATGIKFGRSDMWSATDKLDYINEPPPFEFQWRLYGPFDSAKFVSLERQFRKKAYITNDARVFIVDPLDAVYDTLIFCDTAYYPQPVPRCDTIVVDRVTVSNVHGRLDTILNIDDPLFANDTSFNLIADSSKNGLTGWVTNLRDSIYDAFRKRPSAVTQQARFIFWIRARDDARGPDIAPAFVSFTVVAPKYENNLLVADVEISFELNPRNLPRARQYWDSAYRAWNNGSSDGWVLARDYHMVAQSENVLPLHLLLSHKMVVIVCDDVMTGVFNTPYIRKQVFTALDAGVSVWMCGRSMIAGAEGKPPIFVGPNSSAMPRDDNNPQFRNYPYYFGVNGYLHTGWHWFAIKEPSDRTVEDFIGTASLNTTLWPDLVVDTALLRRYYGWGGDSFLPFRSDLGALPEVGFMISGAGTEVMHLYRSKYGNQSLPEPIGRSLDGRPVMHRLNRGYYRSVVSLFTPYAFANSDTTKGIGKTVKNTLDWMYAPFQSGIAPGTAEFYFPDGPGAVSREKAREIHWQPVEDESDR